MGFIRQFIHVLFEARVDKIGTHDIIRLTEIPKSYYCFVMYDNILSLFSLIKEDEPKWG